eukprot:4359528-Lingulodinium_polyedra.AAC.1
MVPDTVDVKTSKALTCPAACLWTSHSRCKWRRSRCISASSASNFKLAEAASLLESCARNGNI